MTDPDVVMERLSLMLREIRELAAGYEEADKRLRRLRESGHPGVFVDIAEAEAIRDRSWALLQKAKHRYASAYLDDGQTKL